MEIWHVGGRGGCEENEEEVVGREKETVGGGSVGCKARPEGASAVAELLWCGDDESVAGASAGVTELWQMGIYELEMRDDGQGDDLACDVNENSPASHSLSPETHCWTFPTRRILHIVLT